MPSAAEQAAARLTLLLAQYVSRVRVGARPVHLYFVEDAGEVWSHSDAEGTFYVISINDVTKLHATVPVSPERACPAERAWQMELACSAAASIRPRRGLGAHHDHLLEPYWH